MQAAIVVTVATDESYRGGVASGAALASRGLHGIAIHEHGGGIFPGGDGRLPATTSADGQNEFRTAIRIATGGGRLRVVDSGRNDGGGRDGVAG